MYIDNLNNIDVIQLVTEFLWLALTKSTEHCVHTKETRDRNRTA